MKKDKRLANVSSWTLPSSSDCFFVQVLFSRVLRQILTHSAALWSHTSRMKPMFCPLTWTLLGPSACLSIFWREEVSSVLVTSWCSLSTISLVWGNSLANEFCSSWSSPSSYFDSCQTLTEPCCSVNAAATLVIRIRTTSQEMKVRTMCWPLHPPAVTIRYFLSNQKQGSAVLTCKWAANQGKATGAVAERVELQWVWMENEEMLIKNSSENVQNQRFYISV